MMTALEYTMIYIMQSVKIALLVYHLAKSAEGKNLKTKCTHI